MAEIGDAIRIKIDNATHTGFITDADADGGTFGAHIFLTPVDLTSEKDFHHVSSPMYGTGLRHALDELKEGVEDGPRFVLAGEDEKLLEPAEPAPATAVEAEPAPAAQEGAQPPEQPVELLKGPLPDDLPGKSVFDAMDSPDNPVHTWHQLRALFAKGEHIDKIGPQTRAAIDAIPGSGTAGLGTAGQSEDTGDGQSE
jgi:hypothetical protein